MAVALQGDSVALWDQYQKTRDLGVRNTLVLRNMGLVYRLAGKYAPLVPDSLDDLVQEGCLGLIHAVQRFRPDYGVQFSTYAYHVISGTMKNYLRARRRLLSHTGTQQASSQEEPRPDRRELLTASLEELLSSGALQGMPDAFTDDFAAAAVDRVVTRDLLQRLPPLERRIIHHLFYEDLTQREIAARLARSASRISRLLRRGLERVRLLLVEVQEEEQRVSGVQEPSLGLIKFSVVDPETRLFGPEHLQRCLQRETLRARRLNAPLSLVMLGARAAPGSITPQMLSRAAEEIYSRVRVLDHVFRAGPEELAIVFSLPPHAAELICRRFANADSLRDLSYAIASYPEDGEFSADLLASAREGLAAKLSL
jgi:RNA polymerase sigma-B factor